MVSYDGYKIPDEVRMVKNPLRKTTVQFPFQQRPSKKDIRQWHYLIDSVSYNGKLFTPLGPWTRKPDQCFPYMQEINSKIVYKRVSQGWEVFGRNGDRPRYYAKLSLKVFTTPKDCLPVQVIDWYSYIIVVNRDQETVLLLSRSMLAEKESRIYEDQVVGKFQIDENQMDRLRDLWNQQSVRLVGATGKV